MSRGQHGCCHSKDQLVTSSHCCSDTNACMQIIAAQVVGNCMVSLAAANALRMHLVRQVSSLHDQTRSCNRCTALPLPLNLNSCTMLHMIDVPGSLCTCGFLRWVDGMIRQMCAS